MFDAGAQSAMVGDHPVAPRRRSQAGSADRRSLRRHLRADACVIWTVKSEAMSPSKARSKAMNDNRHQDGIYPFRPSGMQSRAIETTAPRFRVRVRRHGQRSSCWHASHNRHCGVMLAERTHRRPNGCRARPAWVGPLVDALMAATTRRMQAADMVGVLDALGVRNGRIVQHDIGINGRLRSCRHPPRSA